MIGDGVTPPGSGVASKGCWKTAVPGQEIINPVDGMTGDIRQHMTSLGFRGDTIELGRADQQVVRCGALTVAVGVGEQVVAATDGDATQDAVGRRVIDLDGAVVAVAQQRRPKFERGPDRCSRNEIAR